MAHDVFISYSSHDKLQADAICNRLESKGIRCWIAPRDVPAGREYAGSIVRAIESARAMVVVYSANADKSPQVHREAERAVSAGLPIIPVRIQNSEMSKEFQYYVGSMHWLDAIDPPLEEHIDKLARDLTALLSVASPDAPAAEPQRRVESPPQTRAAPADGGGKRTTGLVLAGLALLAVGGVGGYLALGTRSNPPVEIAAPTPAKPAEAAAPASTPSTEAATGAPAPAAGAMVAVPDIAGKKRREAKEALVATGLNVTHEVAVEDPQLDAPAAVRTDPAAGTQVKSGSAVTLYHSGMRRLPSVVGLTEAQWKPLLETFKVSVTLEPSDEDEGAVVKMDPPGSDTARLLIGKPVALTVADKKLVVPDLKNKTLDEAKAVVDPLGLKIGTLMKVWDPTVKKVDTIVDVTPQAGAKVKKGEALTLKVAARGGWVYWPDKKLTQGSERKIAGGMNLHSTDDTRSQANRTGEVRAGTRVRIDSVSTTGPVQIVVLD